MGCSRHVPGMWAEIEQARFLNHYLGTNIRPWELGQIPDLYIDVLNEGVALRNELAEAGLLQR